MCLKKKNTFFLDSISGFETLQDLREGLHHPSSLILPPLSSVPQPFENCAPLCVFVCVRRCISCAPCEINNFFVKYRSIFWRLMPFLHLTTVVIRLKCPSHDKRMVAMLKPCSSNQLPVHVQGCHQDHHRPGFDCCCFFCRKEHCFLTVIIS